MKGVSRQHCRDQQWCGDGTFTCSDPQDGGPQGGESLGVRGLGEGRCTGLRTGPRDKGQLPDHGRPYGDQNSEGCTLRTTGTTEVPLFICKWKLKAGIWKGVPAVRNMHLMGPHHPHWAAHNSLCNSSSQERDVLFWPPQTSAYTHTDSHAYTHNLKINLLFKENQGPAKLRSTLEALPLAGCQAGIQIDVSIVLECIFFPLNTTILCRAVSAVH